MTTDQQENIRTEQIRRGIELLSGERPDALSELLQCCAAKYGVERAALFGIADSGRPYLIQAVGFHPDAVPKPGASPCVRVPLPRDAGFCEFYGTPEPALRDENEASLFLQLLVVALEIQRRRADHEADLRRLSTTRQEIQDFVRSAAHDLRSPVITMSNIVQLLGLRYSDKLDVRFHQALQHIQSEIERWEALMRALVSYVDSDAEPAEGDVVEPVSVALALENARERLKEPIEVTRTRIAADELPVVVARRRALVEVLCQLLDNAIKFRVQDRPLWIRIAARRDGNQWIISVQDNGQGLPERSMEKLFQPFKRYHGREYPGSGLGLATCRKLIESLGGRIWAASVEREGSTFYFALPAH